MNARNLPAFIAVASLLAMFSGALSAADSERQDPDEQTQLREKLEAAQKRLDAAAREVADLSMSLSDHVAPYVRTMMVGSKQKAMLGVNLGSPERSELDDGVRIVSVSPGGGAAEAGLRAGDVLIELNGVALKRAGDASPHERLLSAMENISPGDKAAVRYRREGKEHTANVVAREPANVFFDWPRGAQQLHREHLPNFPFMRAEGVFGSAELVPLTPKLGQYFGAEKGLLVVRAPEDARLKLEDGDVILDIDGRTPSSPSHALRILGSYQAGEELKLNILRAKKRMSFDIRIPEDAGRSERGFFSGRRSTMPPVPAPPPPPGGTL